MALGDIDRAARCLHALARGDDGDDARAGAYLIADALRSIVDFDSAYLKRRGERGGIF
jgi:hypothetical protein